MKKCITTDKAPRAIGPYSQAVEAGGFIFVSGQIPLVPATGEIVKGDIEAQTAQVLENLREILTAAGSSLEQAVKTTVYLTDITDFSRVNDVYARYFTKEPPARVCGEVSDLPKQALVEIDVIAAR